MSEQTQMAPTPEEGAAAIPASAINPGKSEQIFQTSSKLATVRPRDDGKANTTVEFGVLRQVPMTVQVEVGRTSMTLGEVLDELEVGSSLRLDRHAGDPVEVYINGALVRSRGSGGAPGSDRCTHHRAGRSGAELASFGSSIRHGSYNLRRQ